MIKYKVMFGLRLLEERYRKLLIIRWNMKPAHDKMNDASYKE
jgi:hypothetical protein